MIFLGLKFWPKRFFGSMKDAGIFFGLQKKKTERFFWVAKKGLRDFLGYAKKSSDFFGQTNSEVVIFWGIKYEPLSDLPVIKICEWGPWVFTKLDLASVYFTAKSLVFKVSRCIPYLASSATR